MSREKGWAILGTCLLVSTLGCKTLIPERQKVGPLEVSVVDTNYYILPYVRVEIEDLKRGDKTAVQNFGRYWDGPFFEGKHRVVIKLGEHSDKMTTVVYDRIHNFTKDMEDFGIRLENVRQRFDIEVAEKETKIPVLPYSERKNILLSPLNNRRFAQRTDISAPVELKILDDIEENFHTNVHVIVRDFRYVTFIRQEYPAGKWIYHAIFANSHSQPFRIEDGVYKFNFSTPNLSFTVSQDITAMNRFHYSSAPRILSGFTLIQTTFETKNFLPK